MHSRRCGRDRHSTYKLDTAKICYRWHPQFGERVVVVQRFASQGKEFANVEAGAGISREMPSWMLDEIACKNMTLGTPVVALTALNELREVLSALSVAAAARSGARSAHAKEAEEAPRQIPAANDVQRSSCAAAGCSRKRSGGDCKSRRTVNAGVRINKKRGQR